MQTRTKQLHSYRWLPLLAVLATCAPSGSNTTTSEATNTSTAPTTTAAAATSTTAGAEATTIQESRTISGESFRHPFTMEAPADDWAVTFRAADWVVEVTGGAVDHLVVTSVGAEDVGEWQALLTSHPSIVATEPASEDVGGRTATVIDVRLAEDISTQTQCGEPCVVLFDHRPSMDLGYNWALIDGYPNRAWLIDLDGGPVAIFAESSEARFPDWASQVGQALATLQWTG